MGGFANSAFSVLLGWIRGTADWLWEIVSGNESGSMFAWLADNWKMLAVILCGVGMLIDFTVHMLRWRPYKVWASFFRRLLGRSEEDAVPQPAYGRAVHREWRYADGTARAEEPVYLDEGEEQAGDDWYQPDEVQPAAEDHDDAWQYRMRYARPAEPAYYPAKPLENLNYQTEPNKEAPVQGLEDYPQPRQAQAETVDPTLTRTERLHKRVARLNVQHFLGEDEDMLDLRYKPIPPAVDKEEAYRKPYYPPQWKRPEDTGVSIGREENGA